MDIVTIADAYRDGYNPSMLGAVHMPPHRAHLLLSCADGVRGSADALAMKTRADLL